MTSTGKWKDLAARVGTALTLLAVIAVPFFIGDWVWAVLIGIFAARMIFEWVRMADPEGGKFAISLAIVLMVAALVTFYGGGMWATVKFSVVAAVLLALEAGRRGKALRAASGFFYILIPSIALIFVRGEGAGWVYGAQQLFWIVLVVAAADVGAYFGGKALGGPKLAPKLSPNKTWSGFLTGLVLGAAVGGAAVMFGGLNPWLGAGLAVPIIIASVIGDFLESGIKRHMDVKDTGTLLPGHGGLLDRFDSHMAATTVAALAIIAF